jgi:D-lactate dehydrogenase
MLTGKYQILYNRLCEVIPAPRMFSDPLSTLAWGTDASFYRLTPKLVIIAANEEEISFILKHTDRLSIPVTFRAAGTSLSGQSLSDSVLIVAADGWKKFEVLEDGKKIRLQPGIIGARANIILAPYGRKIGPDPASINACMVGGIVANNASGMCCGTAENSYNTIDSMKLVLADGTMLDTSCEKSKESFIKSHPLLIENLLQMHATINENEKLRERIRSKFKMKNTTGYSLNAFVDFSDPFDIINHIMVGSEGTLAFISEVTYQTVADPAYKATALVVFPDIESACRATISLKPMPVAAVELIDRAGLRSVENNKGMPEFFKALPLQAAALLIETRAETREDLEKYVRKIKLELKKIPALFPVEFTDIPSEYNKLWNVRKGLFPSVGAMREAGTTVIIEDVAFPLEKLGNATLDLQALFKRYRYDEAVIFGHALEGNLHFVFKQDFGTKKEVERYACFMNDMVDLVVDKYDGTLKAEHGTGRNMAPFVEREWGGQAYILMREIKRFFDPDDLLNPGVIINANPKAHLENLKPLPAVNALIDKCIECGFCESACVSADFTLSPRQRITVLREIERLKVSGKEPHILSVLNQKFEYAGDETCATDGLCAINCPVDIDTGNMIKSLRNDKLKKGQRRIASMLSSNTATFIRSMRLFLDMADLAHRVLGTRAMHSFTSLLRKISGKRIPQWNPFLPRGGKRIKKLSVREENPLKVVYFPSCINRGMGISKDYEEKTALTDKVPALLHKAGYEVIYPKKMNRLCCGMAYSSKGFTELGKKKSNALHKALYDASRQGEIPILCDMSPCLYTMKINMEPDLKLYEPVEFILEHLQDKLEFKPVEEEVAVFAVCSARKMSLEPSLVQLAGMCASKVTLTDANCCGFAGDRGFTVPELNQHGLRTLKEQTESCSSGYSTSRTCEIGLTLHSGKSFKSIVYLVDKVTTAKGAELIKESSSLPEVKSEDISSSDATGNYAREGTSV